MTSVTQLPARIERKIVRLPFCGCWIWMGSGNRYGQVHLNGTVQPAHRAIFKLSGGLIPEGSEVMHSCDIGLCVNPDHLSVGTHASNMRDMVNKGRARAPTGAAHWTHKDQERARNIARNNIARSHGSGDQNNNAKVNRAIAAQIRQAFAEAPNQTMTQLGHRFGLGREQTRKIVKGISWNT